MKRNRNVSYLLERHLGDDVRLVDGARAGLIFDLGCGLGGLPQHGDVGHVQEKGPSGAQLVAEHLLEEGGETLRRACHGGHELDGGEARSGEEVADLGLGPA